MICNFPEKGVETGELLPLLPDFEAWERFLLPMSLSYQNLPLCNRVLYNTKGVFPDVLLARGEGGVYVYR